MVDNIFKRMSLSRSQSRNRLMETSFDSRTFSSTEDLDEVDRLANHPVLRSAPLVDYKTWRSSLKKSLSETEDCLCRGSGGMSIWTGSVSNQGSPVGCSLPRSKAMIFNQKMPRSTTVNVHLNKSNSSPVSAASAPSSWIYRRKVVDFVEEDAGPRGRAEGDHLSNSSQHVVVKAVIEPVPQRNFGTPPPQASTPPGGPRPQTPPNTAPLPPKFAGCVPQNLLRKQQQQQQQQHRTQDLMTGSKAAPAESSSNGEISSSSPKQSGSGQVINAECGRVKALKARLHLDHEDSSSADSTPQKRSHHHHHHHHVPIMVRRGAEVKPPVIAPKPVLELAAKSKFFSSGESSCSSAMSSLESVRSNASEGVQSMMSSESSHSSDASSHYHRSSLARIGAQHPKFQVLSPISDKSQEQYSEQGDSIGSQSKTPKASPTESMDNARSENNNNNNNLIATQTEDVRRAMDVPWEMPKLRRRLQTNLNIQGSDSGISIGSQDVPASGAGNDNVQDLLNVPWDMPKLRKKTKDVIDSESVGGARPRSLPPEPPSSSLVSTDISLNVNLPPPPPGFEDSGDQFYLSQTRPLQGTPERKGKRQRPKMTLSFGVNPGLKTLMFATNSPFSLNDCEEVDPNLPLDRQDWYHGTISKSEGEAILRSHKEGSYLIRRIDAKRQEYALCLKSAKGFMHLRIRRDPNSHDFRLCDFDRTFMTVSQMVHHYTRNRLPIKGAEHMCLKSPVPQQLL